MRAGTLNKIIQIQELTESKDQYGSVTESYTTIKTTRSSINPVNGNEKYINHQMLNEVSHKIEIRYDSNINLTPKYRILYKTKIFDIQNVLNISERNEKLILLCTEKFDEVI